MTQENMADEAVLYTFVSEVLKENYYLLAKEGRCVLIDPGIGSESVAEKCIVENDYEPVGIVLTHAHYDHAAGAGKLGERFSMPVFLHKDDRKVLAHAAMYAQCFSGVKFQRPKDIVWWEGELVEELADFGLEALHVPGHTPGGLALFYGNCIFTGDTLMYETLAKAKLPEENREDLRQSIERLLEEGLRRKCHAIYPGHGRNWTVEEARSWWKQQS